MLSYDSTNISGHVGISARHSNQFRVSVNTEAKSRVTFYLLYEELLQRKRGIYEHVINLTPRQKLKNFGIDVRPQLLGAVEKGSKIWMRYDSSQLGNELSQKKCKEKIGPVFPSLWG